MEARISSSALRSSVSGRGFVSESISSNSSSSLFSAVSTSSLWSSFSSSAVLASSAAPSSAMNARRAASDSRVRRRGREGRGGSSVDVDAAAGVTGSTGSGSEDSTFADWDSITALMERKDWRCWRKYARSCLTRCHSDTISLLAVGNEKGSLPSLPSERTFRSTSASSAPKPLCFKRHAMNGISQSKKR